MGEFDRSVRVLLRSVTVNIRVDSQIKGHLWILLSVYMPGNSHTTHFFPRETRLVDSFPRENEI